MRCPECGCENIIKDIGLGVICANCGLVIDENLIFDHNLI